MQGVCFFDCEQEFKIEYMTDDTSFYIKCISRYGKLGQDSRLYADFSDNTSFEIGLFKKENDVFLIDSRYSLSYLDSQSIKIESLSGFSVVTDSRDTLSCSINNNSEFINDSSVIRAKELLDEIRKYSPADNFIDSINRRIDTFRNVNIPVLSDFNWYLIDEKDEFFGLSSVSFFIKNLSFNTKPWFFGRCRDNRLYAVLIKADKNAHIKGMGDFVTKYRDSSTKSIYCAAGIMLLDDGQYFCRLT